MAANVEELRASMNKYLMVFAALLVLTGVTVGVSYIPWLAEKHVLAIMVALLVAGIKGSLVACYFMHLLDERGMIFWILAFCVLFFITLLLIPVVTSSEVVAGQANRLYGVGR